MGEGIRAVLQGGVRDMQRYDVEFTASGYSEKHGSLPTVRKTQVFKTAIMFRFEGFVDADDPDDALLKLATHYESPRVLKLWERKNGK